jgi:hypothetical protein
VKTKKTPWEIYHSILNDTQGSGHGSRVSTGKGMLRKKLKEVPGEYKSLESGRYEKHDIESYIVLCVVETLCLEQQ